MFGRDSMIAAFQSLLLNPQLAGETLRVLARYQGKEENAWRDEEPGILARVVSTVANMKTNIRQMDSRTADGKATAELTLEIADLKHLERVIRSIADIEGVVHVERKFNVRHATG